VRSILLSAVLPLSSWPRMPASKQPPPRSPLIPEKYLDVPSQRLYYLSLGLLCQVFIQPNQPLSFSSHCTTGRQSDRLYMVSCIWGRWNCTLQKMAFSRLCLLHYPVPATNTTTQLHQSRRFAANCPPLVLGRDHVWRS
jgi:hypothetical protein